MSYAGMNDEQPPNESQIMVQEDSSKPYIKAKLREVPAWMYAPSEDICGRWTKPGFIWTLNLMAAIFHSVLILVTVLVSTNGGKGLDTPTLTIYSREITWNANATNGTSMLTPSLKPAGWELPLSIVTILFFALSAFFHALVCLMNFNQAFAHEDKDARKITRFTGWYFKWLHECRQPARWIEYSFSAAIMSLVIFAAAGLTDDYLLASGTVLISVTMHYGHFAEELCRPMYDSKTGRPTVWAKSANNPDTLFFDWLPCMATFERLFPHLLGYVPYGTVWAIYLHQFLSNASDSSTGQRAPDFVYAIIISQLAIFSCFGITQLLNIGHYRGPSWYYFGEMSYIILSFAAKGTLGCILIFTVFAFQSFEDAVAES